MKKINNIIIKSINPEWLKAVELSVDGFKFNEEKGLVQLKVNIDKDRFDYGEAQVRNKNEKFSVYALNITKEQMANIKLDQKVRFENITKVNTYGEHQNELSITGSVKIYD